MGKLQTRLSRNIILRENWVCAISPYHRRYIYALPKQNKLNRKRHLGIAMGMACMANITSQKAGFLGSQYQQMLGLQGGLPPPPLNPPQGALPLEPRWGLKQPPDPRRDWLPPIIYKLPASTKENKNPVPLYLSIHPYLSRALTTVCLRGFTFTNFVSQSSRKFPLPYIWPFVVMKTSQKLWN